MYMKTASVGNNSALPFAKPKVLTESRHAAVFEGRTLKQLPLEVHDPAFYKSS